MSYNYYSQHQSAAPGRLFGFQRPLHNLLGRGYVADILLWKNKILSAAILVGVTVIWLLFEVVEYHFITLLCHILSIMMIILFVWSQAAGLFEMRRPPSVGEIMLSESTCSSLFGNAYWLLKEVYNVSCGKNLRLYFLTIASLWILSVVAEYFSSLSFLYCVFLCLEILPALYVSYGGEVDYLADKSTQDIQRLFNDFSSKVLNKIPRAPAKEKKYM